MKQKVYKMIGRVKEENGYSKYILGYTSDPLAFQKECVRNGWKKWQIVARPNIK